MNRAPQAGPFVTTHWTVVLSARDGDEPAADAALARLCADYWAPLYAWLRRDGHAPHDAEDLVQGFFEQFLARRYLRSVEPNRGRFRSFLLASLRHHLLNVRRDGRTQRRGGRHEHLSLQSAASVELCEAECLSTRPPDRIFDRVWAGTVMARAAAALRGEHAAAGRLPAYEVLKAWLAREARPGEYAAAAQTLGTSEGAVAVAVHRLRQRYRALVRSEVAHTVASPADIDDELRHLLHVLSDPAVG